MKKIKYIALGVFATLLSSCGNDWLDLQSSTAIETYGSLTELRDFEFVLNGAYSICSHPVIMEQICSVMVI